MLECSSVDICRVQETRFRGKSNRMIGEKTAEYRLFWIGKTPGKDGRMDRKDAKKGKLGNFERKNYIKKSIYRKI